MKPLEAQSCITLDELDNKHLTGYCDSFGNLKTNVSADSITGNTITLTVNADTYVIPKRTTFDDVKSGELVCYRGSNDTLELAVNQGSAEEILGLSCGDEIRIA